MAGPNRIDGNRISGTPDDCPDRHGISGEVAESCRYRNFASWFVAPAPIINNYEYLRNNACTVNRSDPTLLIAARRSKNMESIVAVHRVTKSMSSNSSPTASRIASTARFYPKTT
jgi:hypothetical protein